MLKLAAFGSVPYDTRNGVCPRIGSFLEEFPMTASQKIQKYKLRDLAHELWPTA